MRTSWHKLWIGAGLLVLAACSQYAVERSPFLGYTEEYGIAGQQQSSSSSNNGGSGADALGRFRLDQTVTFKNNYGDAEVNFSFIAWVNVSSIRNADQQDALLRGGYSQLTREVRIGSAFTLPVGTFVYDGGGLAGATAVVLGRGVTSGAAEQATVTATTREITLITPDGMLAYSQPPVACDTVAFYFTDDGQPLTGFATGYGGSNLLGTYKTLAQVSAYQCSPFHPGLFFSSGGARDKNEYLEGEPITFDFYLLPNANGDAAVVTIGTAITTTTTTDPNDPNQG
jgi:hypothetical protein